MKERQRFSFRRIPSRRTRALPTSMIGTGMMRGFFVTSSVNALTTSVGASALVKGAQPIPGQRGSAMARRTLGESELVCAVISGLSSHFIAESQKADQPVTAVPVCSGKVHVRMGEPRRTWTWQGLGASIRHAHAHSHSMRSQRHCLAAFQKRRGAVNHACSEQLAAERRHPGAARWLHGAAWLQ